MSKLKGYRHRRYAQSFTERFKIERLKHSGGWMLKHSIGDTGQFDGTGCYPFFSCEDWLGLPEDLELLRCEQSVVSLSLVVDPLNRPEDSGNFEFFNHSARAFKKHFLVDIASDPLSSIAKNHQRNAVKALRKMEIVFAHDTTDLGARWIELYGILIKRHKITGIAAFSDNALLRQLSVPGLVAAYAMHEGEMIGICLWMTEGGNAWYHLAAYSDTGYQLGASFAIFYSAIQFFQTQGIQTINLGGGAGVTGKREDGLTRFKRGWSNREEDAYFCSHVVDQALYKTLSARSKVNESEFFPAYRNSDFSFKDFP